jgi:hypothetical protein
VGVSEGAEKVPETDSELDRVCDSVTISVVVMGTEKLSDRDSELDKV